MKGLVVSVVRKTMHVLFDNQFEVLFHFVLARAHACVRACVCGVCISRNIFGFSGARVRMMSTYKHSSVVFNNEQTTT